MANCRNCGKPLVISGGKCAYCGASLQGVNVEPTGKGSSGLKSKSKLKLFDKVPKIDGLTLSDVIRKSFISTVIALILAIVMLIIKAWPGCLVSAGVLLFAIATAVYGIVVRAMDMEEPIGVDSEKDKKKAVGLLNHLLNIVILWGYFFFIVGVVCVFISWWAVLIAEIIGVVGALFLLAVGLEIVNG